MKSIRDAKDIYDAIPLPQELDGVVRAAVRSARREPRTHFLRYAVCATAGLLVAFMVAVNTSVAFAQSLYKLPVIGNVARVFTFVEYEKEEEADVLIVRLPAIENTGKDDLERRLNYEIQYKMNNIVEEARARAREYKQAYLETGGTEKEYMMPEILIDYEIYCNNGSVVSFVITKCETFASCYTEQYFYNIDLETGRELMLRDLLGPNYIQIVNESVKRQIKERMASDPDVYYFSEEEGEFVTIAANQGFYVDEQGQVVVVFQKYEIAPGYMGQQTFKILPPG